MNPGSSEVQEQAAAPQGRQVGFRLPLAKPVVTYVLLGIILVVFVVDLVLAQLGGNDVLFLFGAQWNQAVATGWYWQLLTSTFLHAGLSHLAFNCYALYLLGRDTEGLYGSLWFTVIYFLSAVAGSLTWYVFGGLAPSVGASGAIFGLIGAEAAFFLRNRRLFGVYGQQRLRNVVVLIVINVALSFAVPNINILAHFGGLAAGFLVGLFMAPCYAVEWAPEGSMDPRSGAMLAAPTPLVVDTRANRDRFLAIALTVVILIGLVMAGNQRWVA